MSIPTTSVLADQKSADPVLPALSIVTAVTPNYMHLLPTWLDAIFARMQELRNSSNPRFSNIEISVWIWPNTEHLVIPFLHRTTKLRVPLHCVKFFEFGENVPDHILEPSQFAWKPTIIRHHAQNARSSGKPVLLWYLDAGAFCFESPLPILDKVLASKKSVFVLDRDHKCVTWTHPECAVKMGASAEVLEKNQILAGLQWHYISPRLDESFTEPDVLDLLDRWFEWACDKSVCFGLKSHAYAPRTLGHRHDQSILSILLHQGEFSDTFQFVDKTRVFRHVPATTTESQPDDHLPITAHYAVSEDIRADLVAATTGHAKHTEHMFSPVHVTGWIGYGDSWGKIGSIVEEFRSSQPAVISGLARRLYKLYKSYNELNPDQCGPVVFARTDDPMFPNGPYNYVIDSVGVWYNQGNADPLSRDVLVLRM